MGLVLCPLTGLATGSLKSEGTMDASTADGNSYDMKRHSYGHRHDVSHYTATLRCSSVPEIFITCKLCVKDLFILLPDLLLVVFKQSLTQVAHLLQCKRGLVLSWGTWEIWNQISYEKAESSSAAISHRDRNVLSPEIDTPSGENLQLCFLLSFTSASQQGHATLMWANSLSLPNVLVAVCPEPTLASWFFTWLSFQRSAVSRLD